MTTWTIRLIIAAVIFLMIGSAAAWIYQRGGESVRNEFQEKDNKAGNRSDDSKSRFDLCAAGRWDFANDRCRE